MSFQSYPKSEASANGGREKQESKPALISSQDASSSAVPSGTTAVAAKRAPLSWVPLKPSITSTGQAQAAPGTGPESSSGGNTTYSASAPATTTTTTTTIPSTVAPVPAAIDTIATNTPAPPNVIINPARAPPTTKTTTIPAKVASAVPPAIDTSRRHTDSSSSPALSSPATTSSGGSSPSRTAPASANTSGGGSLPPAAIPANTSDGGGALPPAAASANTVPDGHTVNAGAAEAAAPAPAPATATTITAGATAVATHTVGGSDPAAPTPTPTTITTAPSPAPTTTATTTTANASAKKLAERLSSMGLYEEARPYFSTALEQSEVETIKTLAGTAVCFLNETFGASAGRKPILHTEADAMLNEAVRRVRYVTGEPSVEGALRWLCTLAVQHGKQGQHVTALALHSAVRRLLEDKEVLGPCTLDVIQSRYNMGCALLHLGRLEEAEQHLSEAKKTAICELPPHSQVTAWIFEALGEVYGALGDTEGAERVAGEAEQHGYKVGEVYEALGDAVGAERVGREAEQHGYKGAGLGSSGAGGGKAAEQAAE